MAAAFEQLYERFADDVRRWVRAFGAKNADVEDLVHDVFVIALRRYQTFRGESPQAWLYQIARRKVRGYRRLAWNKRVVAVEPSAWLDGLTQDLNTPARIAEMHEQARLLQRVLARVNVEQRLTFLMIELEGRSGEEIALLQNVPLNTVWGRAHRARSALREAARRLDLASTRRRR